jgi:hypothetical protein
VKLKATRRFGGTCSSIFRAEEYTKIVPTSLIHASWCRFPCHIVRLLQFSLYLTGSTLRLHKVKLSP